MSRPPTTAASFCLVLLFVPPPPFSLITFVADVAVYAVGRSRRHTAVCRCVGVAVCSLLARDMLLLNAAHPLPSI